jgi:hypothetical protein
VKQLMAAEYDQRAGGKGARARARKEPSQSEAAAASSKGGAAAGPSSLGVDRGVTGLAPRVSGVPCYD